MYKVFEIVEGALITGSAAPGAVVGVRIGVFTNRGRKILYATHAIADVAGRYRVRVPYATGAGPERARTAPFYRLFCGDDVRVVAVSEAAVVEGETVDGPSLCLGGSVLEERGR